MNDIYIEELKRMMEKVNQYHVKKSHASQLTNKQVKARNKNKAARKARKKQRR